MDEIWAETQNPLFWFTAIGVGLVINILAAYGKTGADKFLAKYSQRRRQKLDWEGEMRGRRIGHMTAHPNLITYRYFAELRYLLYGVFLSVCASIMVAILIYVIAFPETGLVSTNVSRSILATLSGATLILAVRNIFRAGSILVEIKEARAQVERPTAKEVSIDE